MSAPLDPATIALLRPQIIQILNNADLSSISAKKVRISLAQLPPGSLPPSLDLSASKKQVDLVIRDCFDQISKSMPARPQPHNTTNNGNNGNAPGSAPPSGGLALPGLGGVRGGHTTPQPSAPSSASSKRVAESANGSGSGSTSKPKAVEPAKPKKKAAPKKRASTQSDDDDDQPKKKRAVNPNNPFNRPLILAPKLAEVCGGNEVRCVCMRIVSAHSTHPAPVLFHQMPRHAVVKNLWAYIKSNNLQNESNKRQVSAQHQLVPLMGSIQPSQLTLSFSTHAFRSCATQSSRKSLERMWSSECFNFTLL